MTRLRRRDRGAPGVLVALLAGYAVLPLGVVGLRVLYDVTAVAAMVVAFRGVRVHRPAHARGWVLMLAGLSGWVVGDLMGIADDVGTGTPFPAPSDPVYLVSYLVLGAGLLSIVRTRRRSGGDRGAFLDAAILTTGVTVVVSVFLVAPSVTSATLDLPARIVAIAYPVGDVFLLAALAGLVTSPGARNPSYRLLLVAFSVTGLADVAWNLQAVRHGNSGVDDRLINLGWLAGYVLVAVAANSSSMVLVAEPTAPTDAPTFGRRRMVCIGIGLLLPTLVLVVDGLTRGEVGWPVIAAGSAVMSALVMARFVDLISTVQTQAAALAALARTDSLTGISNRRSWDHELSRAHRTAQDRAAHLAVAVLDLDRFKAFNDAHGHQAGDRLLRQAATAWRDALPHDALLARYGGEEFAVLLPGHRLEQAEEAIARLRDRTPSGQTFSAGICEWQSAGELDPTALVAHADRALYQAKRNGRDRIMLARP